MAPRSSGCAMIATRIGAPAFPAAWRRLPRLACCGIVTPASASTNRFWLTSTSLPGSPSASAACTGSSASPAATRIARQTSGAARPAWAPRAELAAGVIHRSSSSLGAASPPAFGGCRRGRRRSTRRIPTPPSRSEVSQAARISSTQPARAIRCGASSPSVVRPASRSITAVRISSKVATPTSARIPWACTGRQAATRKPTARATSKEPISCATCMGASRSEPRIRTGNATTA